MDHSTSRRACGGFTLVELMCTVAVAGFLSTMAYPTYQGVVHKARRADGQVALLQVQMAQERYRADHSSYGGLSEIGLKSASPAGYYTLTMAANTDTGYEVQAAAGGGQSADTPCRHLKLTVDGANVAYGSGPDTAFANTGTANKKCWNQ